MPLGSLLCFLIGAKSIVRISAKIESNVITAWIVIHICPEPQVLRFPLHGKNNESPLVLSKIVSVADVALMFVLKMYFHLQLDLIIRGIKMIKKINLIFTALLAFCSSKLCQCRN